MRWNSWVTTSSSFGSRNTRSPKRSKQERLLPFSVGRPHICSDLFTDGIADYLADSVDAFLTEFASAVPSSPSTEQANPFMSPSLSDLTPEPAVPLGLTFSFPVEQTALNRGKILTWTKGFSAKNAVGHDVGQLLQDAFDRRHMHVKCVAIVNDGSILARSGCVAWLMQSRPWARS